MEENKFFNKARTKATQLLFNNQRLKQLFANSREKLAEVDLSSVTSGKLVLRLKVFIRLARLYANGTYKDVHTQHLLLMVAALIYFVTPLDMIPDFIPVTGFIDDFTIVIWVYNNVREEIDRFITWEENLNNA